MIGDEDIKMTHIHIYMRGIDAKQTWGNEYIYELNMFNIFLKSEHTKVSQMINSAMSNANKPFHFAKKKN